MGANLYCSYIDNGEADMNYKINAYRGNWIVRSTRYFTRNGIGIVVAAFATEAEAAKWIEAQS